MGTLYILQSCHQDFKFESNHLFFFAFFFEKPPQKTALYCASLTCSNPDNWSVLIGGKFICKKKSFTIFALQYDAVISTNERVGILTGHLTFKLRYNQMYQMKTNNNSKVQCLFTTEYKKVGRILNDLNSRISRFYTAKFFPLPCTFIICILVDTFLSCHLYTSLQNTKWTRFYKNASLLLNCFG